MPGFWLDESPHVIRRRFSESSGLPPMERLISFASDATDEEINFLSDENVFVLTIEARSSIAINRFN
jgi:hypothetical protein